MEANKEHKGEVMEIDLESDEFSDDSEQVEVRQDHRDEECTLRVTDHTHKDGMNKENSIDDSQCPEVIQELEVKSETEKKGKTKTRYPCDYCSLVSHSLGNYKKHLMIHTGERPYECITCHKTFRQKNHLLNHQHIHSGKCHFECEVCGCQFKQKSSLILHRKRHKGVKPFPCSECNYAAYEKVHLDAHMRKHSGEKPYQCDKCGQTFSSAYRLKYHCMIHTGERRYKCEKCSVPFREKATLEAHMAVHLDIGPFECDECGQQFPRLASLSLHRKVHENRDNYLYVHNKEALQFFNLALKNRSPKKAVVIKEPSQESEKIQSSEDGQEACLGEEDMASSDKPGEDEESVLVQSRREGTPVTTPQPPHNTMPVPTSSPHDNCSPVKNVLSSSKIDSQDKLKENLTSNLGVEQSCSDVNFDQVRKALEKGTVLETHGDDGKGFFIVLPPSLKNKELMMVSDSIQSTTLDKPNPNMNLEESDSTFGRSNSPNILPENGLGSHRSLYLREESDMNSVAMQEEICSDVEGEMIHPCEAESVECIYNRDHHEEALETMEAFEDHIHSDGTSLHLWKSSTDKLTNVTYIIETGDMEPFIIETEEEGQISELNDGNAPEGNMGNASRRNYYIVEETEGSGGKRNRRCVPVKIKVRSRKSRVRKGRVKRDYKCMHCGKDCKNSSNYIAHSRTHSGERPYFCGFCQEGFKQISHLRSHIRVHTGERPYVCGICLASFTQSSKLSSHKRKAHVSGQVEVREKRKSVPENRIRNFYCRYCNKTFIGECLKVDHMKMHRPLFPYSCKICGMQFKCRKSMQTHCLKHTDNNHICELCGVRLTTLEDLRKHRLEEHGKHPASDLCINVKMEENNAFNVFHDMLDGVVKKRIYNEDETTVCEVKQEVIHVTDDGGNIRSEVEGTSVFEESQVAVHDITHVSPVKEKQKREEGKGVSLSKASNKTVLSSLEDDCNVVGKEEKSKRQIMTYINNDGKKVWMCKVCDRSFAQSSNLYSHIRLHTGDRPYQCSVCSKAFRQITHLKDHMRRHTGVRPHKCSKCNKHFIQKSALKRHIRVLHGGDAVALKEVESNVKIEMFDSPSDCDDVRTKDILEAEDNEHLNTHRLKENVSGVCEEDTGRSRKSLNLEKVGSVHMKSCECGKRFYTIAQLLKHQETCSITEDEEDDTDSEMVSVGDEEENLENDMKVQKNIEKHEWSPRKPDSKDENNTGSADNKNQKNKISTKSDNLVRQGQFKCKECDEVLQDITSYKTHLQGHGGEVQQVCDFAEETTRTKPSNKRELRPDIKGTKGDDLRIRNNTRKKTKSDRELNEISPDASDIDMEIRNHACRTCGMKFTQSLKLRIHKSKCKGHKPNTRKSGDGGKALTNQGGNTKSKISINTPISPTISDNINEDPITKGDGNFGETSSKLKNRTIVGNEAIEFRCKFCDKVFLNTTSYKKHLPSHTADRPFKCEQCYMTFGRKAHLFNHYRRHARKNTS